jgi:hypothetical protein
MARIVPAECAEVPEGRVSAPLELTDSQVQSLADGTHALDAWRAVGRKLVQSESKTQWEIGDWINQGVHDFKKQQAFKVAREATGLDSVTLSQYARISRKFKSDNRVSDLTWRHHRAVENKNPREQRRLLEKAVAEKLSSRQLEALIKEDPGANPENGKHYWLTPPDLYKQLNEEFHFDFDPCPYPVPKGFDGLTAEWGQCNYVNPPFWSETDERGKKPGITAWIRKAIEEQNKGKTSVIVFPQYGWVLMLLEAMDTGVRNLGNVRWLATEDGESMRKGLSSPIAAFILRGKVTQSLKKAA